MLKNVCEPNEVTDCAVLLICEYNKFRNKVLFGGKLMNSSHIANGLRFVVDKRNGDEARENIHTARVIFLFRTHENSLA